LVKSSSLVGAVVLHHGQAPQRVDEYRTIGQIDVGLAPEDPDPLLLPLAPGTEVGPESRRRRESELSSGQPASLCPRKAQPSRPSM
jgi:hypothetical protein